MKKTNLVFIFGIVSEICAIVFLILSIFTDINDDAFLPVALCCTTVGNALILIVNSKRLKESKKAE